MNVLVAGGGADNIAKQCGGWTLTWLGAENSNPDFPGATSIFEGIRSAVQAAGGKATLSVDGTFESRPDVAIVVFGENPYSEWVGDIQSIAYPSTPAFDSESDLPPPPESGVLGHGEARTREATRVRSTLNSADADTPNRDLALLLRLKNKGIPVVSIFLTGRPLWITPELNASDAFVVAWLPGSEGGGISDLLFRDASADVRYDFTGKLSYSWPRDVHQTPINRGDRNYHPLFPYGFGLTYRMGDRQHAQHAHTSSRSYRSPTSPVRGVHRSVRGFPIGFVRPTGHAGMAGHHSGVFGSMMFFSTAMA
jgi:beta-glucosidase